MSVTLILWQIDGCQNCLVEVLSYDIQCGQKVRCACVSVITVCDNSDCISQTFSIFDVGGCKGMVGNFGSCPSGWETICAVPQFVWWCTVCCRAARGCELAGLPSYSWITMDCAQGTSIFMPPVCYTQTLFGHKNIIGMIASMFSPSLGVGVPHSVLLHWIVW